MKIAYLSPIYFSDVDLSYLAQAQNLCDITYITTIFPNGLKGAAFNLDEFYPKTGIFKAKTIYPQLEKFGQIIDLDKFYVVNAGVAHGWSFSMFWLQLKLLRFILKNKFDVIHLTDFPYYYNYWLYLLRKKFVLTVHDPFPHSCAKDRTKQKMFNRKLGFSLFQNFIILNKAQRDDFIAYHHLQNKNVMDSRLSCYDYLQMYQPKAKNDNYVLFFGQITEHKGLDVLFEAMQKIHEGFLDVKLIVAGNGKFPFDIEPYKKMDYFDIRNRFIPDEELADLIYNAQFVVCPYNDATQSGVVMSAFAFNKPVVATNVGGLPEMVVNGEYGVIIPPRDVTSLTVEMTNLLNNPASLKTYAANIERDYSMGNKSWKYIANEMKTVYEQIAHECSN